MNTDTPKTGRVVLNGKTVEARTETSRVQRWRMIREGSFPAPVELSPNKLGWFEDEIDAWLESRPRRTYRPEEASA